MVSGIKLGEPDISFLVDSDAVRVRNFRKESVFLGFNIEFAERASRTPDISLQVRDGGVPARIAGLSSRGVTQSGPWRVGLHFSGWRAVVWLAKHFKLFRARIES